MTRRLALLVVLAALGCGEKADEIKSAYGLDQFAKEQRPKIVSGTVRGTYYTMDSSIPTASGKKVVPIPTTPGKKTNDPISGNAPPKD